MSIFMNHVLSLGQAVLGLAAPDAVATVAPQADNVDPLARGAVQQAGSSASSDVDGVTPAASAAGDGASSTVPPADAVPSAAAADQNMLDAASQAAVGLTDVPGVDPAELANQSMGFMHFVAQSDTVGKALFVILVVMSMVSWYLILVKAGSNIIRKRRSNAFLNRFWKSSSLDQVEKETVNQHGTDPYSHLTLHAIEARRYHAQYGATNLEAAGSNAEFVTRAMRKVIDEETAKLEAGLTVLASVGSTAPFVGLFGTVWGVYHALVSIGMSDGVTINRIAGPVGEALIMTGLGLAVAIPAVLAYNAFVRSNRVQLSRLDAFAHDLFAFLGTGQQVPVSDGRTRAMRRLGEQPVKRSA